MTTRTFPKSKVAFLRYQVGEVTTRVEQSPVYDLEYKAGKIVKGYVPCLIKTSNFVVKGFGATLEAAEKMAGLVKTT